MIAARLHGAGDIRPETEPVPDPGPGDELVRVTAVGICGSDLHWFAEGTALKMRAIAHGMGG
jgi:L-iditol 2-dehydrogenase